jgi:histidinol-phosphatase (PHP family)
MLIDFLSDGHIHTSLCHHAVGTMEDYVLSAIAKGLHGIIFLEHMEEEIDYFKTTWLTEEDFDTYFAEGKRLQQKYHDRLMIGLGVEVGYNPLCRHQLLQRLCRRQWDRIGISYHFHRVIEGAKHLNLVSRADARVQALSHQEKDLIENQYYRTLIEAVIFLPGTVLCHLDAVLRHHPHQDHTAAPWPVIEELLDTLKHKGMALEINTSGIAIRNECFPTREIIRMAIARGIPLLAGSDAHRPEDVGNHFSSLEEIVSS